MYDEFFSKAHRLLEAGQPFATAVVVRSERPTSGKPGDKAIVTLDGVMYGWIGGSCAQPAVIEEARAALADGESRLLRITPEPATGAQPEGVKEVGMSCFSGGTLEVYVEPQQPQPRLLVIGHLPTARALIHLGKAMSYRVVAVDLATDGAAVAHADEVWTEIEPVASRVTPLTYVVVASHGHYDESALEQVLATPAPYIGLVASRQRAQPILRYLQQRGLSEHDLARIKAPAGLDIGARRGDEIALSIMTEIVQRRRAAEGLEWPLDPAGEAQSPDDPVAVDPVAVDPAAIGPAAVDPVDPVAVDPVCGMSVSTLDARHTFEHAEEAFYFCCEGCRRRFASEPERFLAGETSADRGPTGA